VPTAVDTSIIIGLSFYNIGRRHPLCIGSVETSGEKTSSTLFDLQGRRLTQAPAKGVFIQNGKKVIY